MSIPRNEPIEMEEDEPSHDSSSFVDGGGVGADDVDERESVINDVAPDVIMEVRMNDAAGYLDYLKNQIHSLRVPGAFKRCAKHPEEEEEEEASPLEPSTSSTTPGAPDEAMSSLEAAFDDLLLRNENTSSDDDDAATVICHNTMPDNTPTPVICKRYHQNAAYDVVYLFSHIVGYTR